MIDKMFLGEKYDSLFEVGCSSGYYLESAERVGGIDIHQENVRTCQGRYPENADNFHIQDARNAPWDFPDKSFDIVFTVGTLLLMKDAVPVVKEMVRIAKKAIIIAEPHSEVETIEGHERDTNRVTRNYIELFKSLGLNPEVKGEALTKTVIKCTL